MFEETIAPGFLDLKFFRKCCALISILSTTASTTQSASLTASKSSFIFPTFILFIFVFIYKQWRSRFIYSISSLCAYICSKSNNVTGILALHK